MKATSLWLPIAVPALVTRSPIVHGTGAPRPLMGAYSAPIPPSLIGYVTVKAHDRLPVRDLGGHLDRQAVDAILDLVIHAPAVEHGGVLDLSPVLHAQADALGLALSHQCHPSPCPGRTSRPRWDGGTLGL